MIPAYAREEDQKRDAPHTRGDDPYTMLDNLKLG